MDLSHCLHRVGIVEGVSKRIRALQDRFARGAHAATLVRHRRLLGYGSLLLTALVLAIQAQDLAQNQALSGWLRSHPPSERIWRHALLSRGYSALEDVQKMQKAARTIPTLVDEEGSVWATADASWIAVFSRRSEGTPNALFCIECDRAPQGWAPSGVGWNAFDPVLERVDQAAISRRKPTPARPAKSAPPRDPRELVY